MHSIPLGGSSICVKNWINTLVAKVSWPCRWGPVQTLEAISCCPFHHEACRCLGGPCILEGLSSFLGRQCKRLVVLPCTQVHHELGWSEEIIPCQILPSFKDNSHNEILGIKQQSRETLYEYWEMFKNLCSSCPHHQISEHLLLQYFYAGLYHMDRNMIDAASGSALGNIIQLQLGN